MMLDYKCPECGWMDEELFFSHETPHDAVKCPDCGGRAPRLMPVIADTKSMWGDSHGYYDRGLGTYITGTKHKDRVCRERGLVPMSSLDKHFYEDRTEREQAKLQKQDDLITAYQDNLVKYDGDSIRASTEAMPAIECLDGTLDSLASDLI